MLRQIKDAVVAASSGVKSMIWKFMGNRYSIRAQVNATRNRQCL
jgi:hypothetical protein